MGDLIAKDTFPRWLTEGLC
jgi:hypothetical protein